MNEVKLTFPYPDWPIERQLPESLNIWRNTRFHINPPSTDQIYNYYFAFNYLCNDLEETIVRNNNIILITPEPATIETYDKKFVKQFSRVIASQRWINHKNKIYSQQGLPWFSEKTYDEVTSMEIQKKTNTISIIASNKLRTRGHKLRLRFVENLKMHFKGEIDLYGRDVNSFDRKWDVLAPYKYTTALENSRFNDYFNDKITNAFLAFSTPIYLEAPNINIILTANRS
jgi:hypothetical protein